MKCEVPIRSGPLDHRGSWVVDLEYFGYRELEESGLAHVQTPEHARSRFDHSRRSKGERGPD
jgi:hypothetical protein